MVKLIALVLCFGFSSAFPTDQVVLKWHPGPRYSYLRDDNGTPHLVDQWVKMDDLTQMARYNPDASNVYHLFTRANPSTSQPLVPDDLTRLLTSNYDPRRRTVILMHGFMGSATSGFNTVLVPAYLEADDCNVIVIDWSAGSWWGLNAIQAAEAAARFVNWMGLITGSDPRRYLVVGYSVGGHAAGIIARNVRGDVGYVIGLDPAERWSASQQFLPTDGLYTEVIHTSSMGEQQPLALVDFYPNGGSGMPGCLTQACDHYRSYFYLAESVTSGGFTGRRCKSLQQALSASCDLADTLHMGGLEPKNGKSGIFYLATNRRQPFSQG